MKRTGMMSMNVPKMDLSKVPSYKEISRETVDNFVIWLVKKTWVYEVLWETSDEDFFYPKDGGGLEMFSCQSLKTKVGPLEIRLVSKEVHPKGVSAFYLGIQTRGTEPIEVTATLLDALVHTAIGTKKLPAEKILKAIMSR
jgi:hypothetical protein